MKKIPKIIHCPICEQRVLKYDGRTETPQSCLCKKCNRLVTYFPNTDLRKISRKPERVTSSGCRFW